MRAQYNVLVLPYMINDNETLFCIFKRQDMQIWQFVAGGGENKEIPIEAARRELYEETQMNTLKVFKLDATTTVPVEYFKDFNDRWEEGLFVIPVYSFAAEAEDSNVTLSSEHVISKWLNYEESMDLLHFDIDKTALWELNKRMIVERKDDKNALERK